MAEKRQVVFLMTDTQRKDMLGCYGNPDMKTPNLDRLAAEGVRFEKAYTCQPVCGPARSAIFTGTYPHSNGMWGNSMPLGDNVYKHCIVDGMKYLTYAKETGIDVANITRTVGRIRKRAKKLF